MYLTAHAAMPLVRDGGDLVFWRAWWVVLVLVCGGLAFGKATLPGWFSNEIDASDYDCTMTLTPAKGVGKKDAVRLSLEWGNGKTHTLVTVTPDAVLFGTVTNRKVKTLATIPVAFTLDVPNTLTIMRRGPSLGVLRNGAVLARHAIPRSEGQHAGIVADAGWAFDPPSLQRLEPVSYSDDFMRTADDAGTWAVQRGQWGIKTSWDDAPHGTLPRFAYARYAQNPFAWGGRSGKEGSALCTVGRAYWEDYTLSVSMRPAASGAAGVAVNMPDAAHGLLVRWSPVADRGKQGNCLTLSRLDGVKVTELARDAGGYLPGQWYRLAVTSTIAGVTVAIDGAERLSVQDATPWRGGIGLYCEGAADTVFDDVTVYGRALNTDLLLEDRATHIGQQFVDDPNGMKEWAINIDDWAYGASFPSPRWYRWGVYGDQQWITLTLQPYDQPTGELTLALNATAREMASGYRAVVKAEGNPPKPTYLLYRKDAVLAKKAGEPLAANAPVALRFKRTGARLALLVDGDEVVSATDDTPLTGSGAGYLASGSLARTRDAQVLSYHSLDYPFTGAPTDWLEDGTWVSTIRWSCSPSWSFLSGWSRGDAALWHKQRFGGDQEFQAFVGLKMEYPREVDFYENRYRDFGITICGDGRNPRSGYSGIYGAADEDGTPNRRTVLMRNGKVVVSNGATAAGKSANHRNWFDLQLRKRGNTVEFWVEGELQLTYVDPEPIDAGVPAIWTTNNGISLARARLFFANPPAPRTEARVVIDDPWYPEWANLNTPVTLAFPQSWSGANRPVALEVAKRTAPAGAAPEIRVAEKTVTLTPKATGDYWYQITARDKEAASAPFDLFFPVFNPAAGRDDSRALVLYRFDEGAGKVIHDRGAVKPAADLTIVDVPDTPVVDYWLPGQGLAVHGSTPIKTAAGVAKLLALAKTRACTLEMWLSTDTIYPPSGWAAALFSWGAAEHDSYLTVGHYFSGAPGNVIAIPPGARFDVQDTDTLQAPGFRTGLQHIAVTWDGTTTTCYINGKFAGSRTLSWLTARWSAAGTLTLGNLSDYSKGYRGTFYLFAIHDRCFTAAEVGRHYMAGPSGR